MNLSWRRVENCRGETNEKSQRDVAALLLPQPDPSWALLDAEASAMLHEVAMATRSVLNGNNKSLTFQDQFRLRRVIECLAMCGFECELLQTWKSEVQMVCRNFAEEFNRDHQSKSLDQLASEAKDYLDAVDVLAEAGAPLDFVYTYKTPNENTTYMCCQAFKECLAKPDEFRPDVTALDQLVESTWKKMIKREAQMLALPHKNMVESLEDSEMLQQMQMITKFFQNLNIVSPELLSSGVNTLIDVIFRDFKNASNHMDQSLIVSKLLAASEITVTRLRSAYVGSKYKTLKALFLTRLKSKLFEHEELDMGNTGIWLTQEYQRRQVVDLNGIWKPIIETHTTFEWIFLHDGENWKALNAKAKDSEAYINNVLSAWAKFLSRSCADLISDSSAVTSVELIGATLVWINRLTSQAEVLFGQQVNKYTRDALIAAFTNRPVVCEAFTEYVEHLWSNAAAEIEYQKLMPIFRALSNKSLAQSLLEAALLRTLLIRSTPPNNCSYFINLLQAECGENYVTNLKAALNEFTDNKNHLISEEEPAAGSDAQPCDNFTLLNVKVISARLYNSQCAADRKVIPSATCVALPCWGLPSLIHEEFRRYIDNYKRKHAHRLLTFAMEVSSVTVRDSRSDQTLEVSASQFLLLNIFNTSDVVTPEQIEELYKDGQGSLVVVSLAPLVIQREDNSIVLGELTESVIDYRGQWLSHWSGSDHSATGTNSPLQAAIRASLTLFYDVGLDAFIMRTLKRKTCDFKLLKAAVDMYGSERFGNHVIPESVIKEHLERLSARDFISMDQNIISLSN